MSFRDTEYNTALGNYLSQYRKKTKLTQKTISRVFGYSGPQFISNFERGKSPVPMHILSKLKNIYDIPPTEFINFILDLEKSYWKKSFSLKK